MATDTIARLIDGQVTDPDTGTLLTVPTKSVVIADTLRGKEGDLVQSLGFDSPLALVCDPTTYEVLGRRVERALASLGRVSVVMLDDHPHADVETAEIVRTGTKDCRALIAVGSGTINDLCKFTAAGDGKPCAVFATAPSMNGYTSVSAAITDKGHKKSLPAVAPAGVFMDLEILAAAPKRMIQSGLGDSVCRCTAQADWLMAHIVHGGEYRSAPFALLTDDEKALLAAPEALVSGDLQAMKHLCRTLILSGFGMTVTGGSYPASQGEHLISHYLEMMHPADWPETFHGEQIAVTTLVMARLQERILGGDCPQVAPPETTEADMIAHFGRDIGGACWREFSLKRLDGESARRLNQRLREKWPEIQDRVGKIVETPDRLASVLERAGAPVSYGDIHLSRDFFGGAVTHAREIRNRYTFLDLAVDSGQLDPETLV